MTYSTIIHSSNSSVVFNPEKLVRQMSYNQSRAIAIIEIVDRLICEASQPINEARKAFNREQPHQASHMLHTLKGSISNIGGMRVVDIIDDLEDSLDSSKINNLVIDALFECLDREYHALLKEAEKWLAQQRGKLISKSALKAEQEKAQVKQLKEHLENNNLKAYDAFQELQAFLQTSLSTEDFQGLGAFIHRLEFDKALRCIQSI